jgi:GNAT superfamily N-acetyltransferase
VTITIRDAGAADLDALATLNDVVQRLHAELMANDFPAAVDVAAFKAFFAGVIDHNRHHVRLAIVDGRPVGYIWFEQQERPATPFKFARRQIYVHHLAVSDDARRAGVASALMRAADDLARAEGLDQLCLDTWAVNGGALQFFEQQGFAAAKLVLRKSLG